MVERFDVLFEFNFEIGRISISVPFGVYVCACESVSNYLCDFQNEMYWMRDDFLQFLSIFLMGPIL